MGTVAEVEVHDPVPDLGIVDETFAWLHEVDRRFSTYKADSEVNRLDRGEITLAECSADMRFVLDQCAALWKRTDGYFDIYSTGRLDPSGYVKGWAVQVASERLTAAGVVNHYVEAGGDIQVRGRPSHRDAWLIGVRSPMMRDQERVAWVLRGNDMAVATSGIYERGLHVINPRDGKPADLLQSVTVVGRDLGDCDAYATAAVAMGQPGLTWLAGLSGFESAVITSDGRGFTSSGLPVDESDEGRT